MENLPVSVDALNWVAVYLVASTNARIWLSYDRGLGCIRQPAYAVMAQQTVRDSTRLCAARAAPVGTAARECHCPWAIACVVRVFSSNSLPPNDRFSYTIVRRYPWRWPPNVARIGASDAPIDPENLRSWHRQFAATTGMSLRHSIWPPFCSRPVPVEFRWYSWPPLRTSTTVCVRLRWIWAWQFSAGCRSWFRDTLTAIFPGDSCWVVADRSHDRSHVVPSSSAWMTLWALWCSLASCRDPHRFESSVLCRRRALTRFRDADAATALAVARR